MKSMTNNVATFQRILMVPAERELDECIDDVMGELTAGIDVGLFRNGDCALVVLETGTVDTARHNQQLFRKRIKDARQAFPAIHIMPETLEHYIVEVCGFDRKLSDMFSRKNCNLGRLANICSLIAVSFDARYLHVRMPAARTAGAAKNDRCTALEKELTLLARCSGEVGVAGETVFYNNTPTKPVAEFPKPIGETFADLSKPTNVYNNTPGSSNYLYTSAPKAFLPPKNCYAYKNLFRYFASPPHRETPGTESFFMLLAGSAGIPIKTYDSPLIGTTGEQASMPSPVILANHDPEISLQRPHIDSAAAERFARSYAVMFARYIDFTTVYSLLADFKPLLKLSPTVYISDALHALADKAIAMTDHRKSLLYSFADSIAVPGNNSGRYAATAVRDAIPTILSSNYRQIKSHALLQKQWKRLVMRAACQEIAIDG